MPITKHYANCLYIHGLHSTINTAKIEILEQYVQSTSALNIDYMNEPNTYEMLRNLCLSSKVDCIVGSSFGGYLGFYLSRDLQLPAILFNPSLYVFHQDKQFVTVPSQQPCPFGYIVIGKQDEVIPPATTFKFLEEDQVQDNLKIVTCDWLPHMIDLATFEAQVAAGLLLSKNQ